jgi:hypothetical protein
MQRDFTFRILFLKNQLIVQIFQGILKKSTDLNEFSHKLALFLAQSGSELYKR